MNNQFDSVQPLRTKSNVFDLSHEVKLTMNMGKLVPFFLSEIVPGDKFTCDSEILIRLQPLLAPVMHRVDVFTHFFFVPNRIIDSNWEKFITGGEDGLDESILPQISINPSNTHQFAKGHLSDYLGIPPQASSTEDISINALPFMAYQKIYNDYYRDQNFEEEIDITDTTHLHQLQTRAWEHDYFTSALPWAQRGGEVSLPIGDTAPIQYKPFDETTTNGPQFVYPDGTAMNSLDYGQIAADDYLFPSSGHADIITESAEGTTKRSVVGIDPNGTLEADLSAATAVTIEDIRRTARLQEWLERNARGGSRYIEQILMHFNVVSSDARLQRPEYLGGGKQPIVISEVLSTYASDTQPDTPQGTMTGHGISVGKSNRFSNRFEEHGHVLGIMSVLPRTNYQNGVNKLWLRQDKLDFLWPEFAQLGEQEIDDREVYLDLSEANTYGTFGYVPRYAEYKYLPSRVAGDMRDSLDHWHFGRQFDTQPALNNDFMKANVRKDPFAVTDPDEHELIVQIFNRVKAVRKLPYFNNPTL